MENKTATVRQLIAALKKLPQDHSVYLASDPEGNGFGSIKTDYMVGGSYEDKAIVLYPLVELSDDEIMPIMIKQIMDEIKSQKL